MIAKIRAFGTSFVGLFISISGERILVHPSFPRKKRLEDIAKTAEMSVRYIPIESRLVGLFITDTEPAFSGEFTSSKDVVFSEAFMHYAMGNLVVANRKGAIISPVLENHADTIKEILGVKRVAVTKIGGYNTPGAVILANEKGAVVHPSAGEEELDLIEKTLGVTADYGTVAKSGFVGAMAAASNDLLLLPEEVLAPEIVQISQVLEVE